MYCIIITIIILFITISTIVTHVVSSSKFALKAEEAGCDAIVAEGFEAGGHNGREETTSMVGLLWYYNLYFHISIMGFIYTSI